jgi:hypothetical protein
LYNLEAGRAFKSSISGMQRVVAGAVQGCMPASLWMTRTIPCSVGGVGDGARTRWNPESANNWKRNVRQVVSILEPLVGGKIHANASIDIGFNGFEQTEETFNPNPRNSQPTKK